MHPLWLLLDTACPRAVVALACDGEVLAEVYLDEYKKHGEKMAEAVQLCLDKTGHAIGDLEAVAVGVGPGSFIGVRIAVAYAKGLCLALQIPLVGFNTLLGVPAQGAKFVAIDARRSEFYVLETGQKEANLVKLLPENTYLETKGPVAKNILTALPKQITDQTMTLIPNYIRDSQC